MKAALLAAMVGCVYGPAAWVVSTEHSPPVDRPAASSPAEGQPARKDLTIRVRLKAADVWGLAATEGEANTQGSFDSATPSDGYPWESPSSDLLEGFDVAFDAARTGVLEEFLLPTAYGFQPSVTDDWEPSSFAVKLVATDVLESNGSSGPFRMPELPSLAGSNDEQRSRLSILPTGDTSTAGGKLWGLHTPALK